jgi:hypothetical protein
MDFLILLNNVPLPVLSNLNYEKLDVQVDNQLISLNVRTVLFQ